jgi:hypothetical protein
LNGGTRQHTSAVLHDARHFGGVDAVTFNPGGDREKGGTPVGARPWKKGQAPNPTGKGGDYHEALRLASQTSMRSITRLIELRESADEQIATVASKALWEISWGKPKDYDPKAEEVQERPPFDPSLYMTEELRRMQEVMLMIAHRQGLLPDEEGEDVAD